MSLQPLEGGGLVHARSANQCFPEFTDRVLHATAAVVDPSTIKGLKSALNYFSDGVGGLAGSWVTRFINVVTPLLRWTEKLYVGKTDTTTGYNKFIQAFKSEFDISVGRLERYPGESDSDFRSRKQVLILSKSEFCTRARKHRSYILRRESAKQSES